nr:MULTISPECIES: EAL domain-containing protein [unclassified Rhizobium]
MPSARALMIEVVAEGAETPKHADVLRDLGVDVLQGYALNRPEPWGVVTRTLSLQDMTVREHLRNRLV